MDSSPQDRFTDRFLSALKYAFHLHKNQIRKSKDIPYFAHLMSVTAMVLEAGGDEEEAIAALLHDAVEDQGGRSRLAEIHDLFGKRVADIVDGCTDAYQTPKPPWRERKEAYLKHLENASPSVILVSLADKVHNARAIYHDLKRDGDLVWERFTGGKEGTLWYYRQLVKAFHPHADQYPILTQNLVRLVEEINRLANKME
ncbi:MAG: HD domain-containing protein [Anaerolineales bacterium]